MERAATRHASLGLRPTPSSSLVAPKIAHQPVLVSTACAPGRARSSSQSSLAPKQLPMRLRTHGQRRAVEHILMHPILLVVAQPADQPAMPDIQRAVPIWTGEWVHQVRPLKVYQMLSLLRRPRRLHHLHFSIPSTSRTRHFANASAKSLAASIAPGFGGAEITVGASAIIAAA